MRAEAANGKDDLRLAPLGQHQQPIALPPRPRLRE